ncbi:MAG: hypothetical protein ACRCZO_01600, partial [Cetobacterium sp.]
MKIEVKWAYEWHVTNVLWAKTACELAKNRTKSFDTDHMLPDNLHCTSHVVTERDEYYEKDWFQGEEGETLRCSKMFWTDKVCALSVELTEKQHSVYLMTGQLAPHISLVKAKESSWGEVGQFVRQCMETKDWFEKDDNVSYSVTLKAFMSEYEGDIRAERIIAPLEKQSKGNQRTVQNDITEIHPALAEVPETLWAKHKYDVGLIKNCEPVVIVPKSDYRPCQQQYPLKKEAILGITPVFESLLKEGVIVPCNDSPVRTPIFPVKKIRDKGQPTEWRFVQDLQAVNSAVRQRAPLVANPYTILSQIPKGAEYFSVVDLANAYFSVPVDKDSTFWFAFNFNGKGYKFQRLCQGF